MISDEVLGLCEEFGLQLISGTNYPKVGQTRAGTTIQKIFDRHGYDHLRLVIMTLCETQNNKGHVDRILVNATSILVLTCREIIERDPTGWFDVWDRTPVGQLQWVVRDLSKHGKQSEALAGMLYERVYRAFGPPSQQPDLFDERRTP